MNWIVAALTSVLWWKSIMCIMQQSITSFRRNQRQKGSVDNLASLNISSDFISSTRCIEIQVNQQISLPIPLNFLQLLRQFDMNFQKQASPISKLCLRRSYQKFTSKNNGNLWFLTLHGHLMTGHKWCSLTRNHGIWPEMMDLYQSGLKISKTL